MFAEQLRLLGLLYAKPLKAAGRILDEGRLLFALSFAVLAGIGVHAPEMISARVAQVERRQAQAHALPQPELARSVLRFMSYESGTVFSPFFSLALLFVPAAILASTVFDSSRSFGVAIYADYLPVLMCLLMTWTAAHLPLALFRMASMDAHALPWFAAAHFYF